MLFAGPAESDRGEHLMTLANPSRVVGALTLQSVHSPRIKDCCISNIDADGGKEPRSSKCWILLIAGEIFVGAPTNRVPRVGTKLSKPAWLDASCSPSLVLNLNANTTVPVAQAHDVRVIADTGCVRSRLKQGTPYAERQSACCLVGSSNSNVSPSAWCWRFLSCPRQRASHVSGPRRKPS
jgi:hypothetical protein